MPIGRVLYVEDNFICSLETCEHLREQGFIVSQVYSAPAAVEAIKRHNHLLALVTDIDLGDGDDGFFVGRQARAVYPELPVIYVPGTAAHRHAAAGVCGSIFIAKPFHPQQVADALNRAIRLKAA